MDVSFLKIPKFAFPDIHRLPSPRRGGKSILGMQA